MSIDILKILTEKCLSRVDNTKGAEINPLWPKSLREKSVDITNKLNVSAMTFSLQSPGDEQYNNGKSPHSCKDITNLSCFGFFFNSLTVGAHRRIFSYSVGQNCPALLSFQLFKKKSQGKRWGWENLVSLTLHHSGDL